MALTNYIWECGKRFAHIKMSEEDMKRMLEYPELEKSFMEEVDRLLERGDDHTHAFDVVVSAPGKTYIKVCLNGEEVVSSDG